MDFGRGVLMDPAQVNTNAELLIRTIKWGFCLTVLTLRLVISAECQDEGNCTTTEKVVQEGHSVEVPLNTSETVSDLCVWNNSMRRWVYVLDFPTGKKFSSSFKENVSIDDDGTFRILNVNKDSRGSYKLQDNEANCVAVINVSVTDPDTISLLSSSAPGLTHPSLSTQNHRLPWVFLLQLLAVLLFTF